MQDLQQTRTRGALVKIQTPNAPLPDMRNRCSRLGLWTDISNELPRNSLCAQVWPPLARAGAWYQGRDIFEGLIERREVGQDHRQESVEGPNRAAWKWPGHPKQDSWALGEQTRNKGVKNGQLLVCGFA